MDVKKIFLNEDLDEEIYMEQPLKKKKVCKLVKSSWLEINMRNLTRMMQNGFKKILTK